MANFTKNAITMSFVKLLNEKSLDKITVKDIIEDCKINRSTFYYHFENVYDCLVYLLKMEAEVFAESHAHYESWPDGIIEAMSFALQNKKAIYHIYKSVNREELENYLATVFDTVLRGYFCSNINEIADTLNIESHNYDLVIDMYKYGIIGLIFKWLREGMPGEPADDIRKLGKIMDGDLNNLLLIASKET